MSHLRPWALVALLAAALVPTAATAQTGESRFYGSVSGLYVVPMDSDASQTLIEDDDGETETETGTAKLEMDAGFGFLVAVGYGRDTGLRGEVEFGYRKSDFDKLDGATILEEGDEGSIETYRIPGQHDYDGDVKTLSLMANGIFAFEAGRLRPYVGVGLGLAKHDATFVGSFDAATEDGPYVDVDETRPISVDDTVLAYQGMAGVSFPVSENAEVRLGYRWFATADADSRGHKFSYDTHNIEAGVLFRF